jgi:hypothetical protein
VRKAFENRRDRLLPAFKISELALAGFQNRRVGSGCPSKSASWLWPVLKSFSQIQKVFVLNGKEFINSI